MEIPVGGGDGPIDKLRHTKAGDLQWGDGSEVGTIKIGGVIGPLAMRVIPTQAINTLMHGGSGAQIASSAGADAVNMVAHPAIGPMASSVIAAAGYRPYSTGFLNQTGHFGVQFMPSVPQKLKPGFLGGLAPGMVSGYPTKHPGAAAGAGAALAAGVGQLGSSISMLGNETGLIGEDQKKGNLIMRTLTATVLPLLTGISLGSSYNPYGQQNYLMQQKRALADMSLPAALKTYEAANQEEKQAMYRTVRDKVYAAKVQGRLAGDDLALAHHYFKVPMPAMMSPQPIGGGQ
jgi:hypothetical protein